MIKVNATPENRTEIMQMVDVFRARIVDVTNNSFIIEITGDEDKDRRAWSKCCKPLGIIEMVRTGHGGHGARRRRPASPERQRQRQRHYARWQVD